MLVILISDAWLDVDGAILDLLSVHLFFNAFAVVKRTRVDDVSSVKIELQVAEGQ